jgi:hypothetical protein
MLLINVIVSTTVLIINCKRTKSFFPKSVSVTCTVPLYGKAVPTTGPFFWNLFPPLALECQGTTLAWLLLVYHPLLEIADLFLGGV